MLATRRHQVAELNQRARDALLAAGELQGPVLLVGGLDLVVGDRVMTLKNRARLGVTNGARATVVAVDQQQRSVTVLMDGAGRVVLPFAYLEAGHLSYAHAMTVHKAQGLTCDRALLLGDLRLFLEAGYTGLSRGREANRLYVVGEVDPDGRELAHLASERSGRDALLAALRRSEAKALGIEKEGRRAGAEVR